MKSEEVFSEAFFFNLEKNCKMRSTGRSILSLIKAMILKLLESQIPESDESYGPLSPQNTPQAKNS